MNSAVVGIIAGIFVCSYFVLALGIPPLIVLLGDIIFFTAFSLVGLVASKRFFFPSAVLSVALCILLASIVLYPRILAIQARTPQEQLIAAKSLAADWRIPFQSEAAAWPHYLSAAEGGIPDAECTVGMAYLYRYDGVTFDRAKARYWLEAAASQGSIQAQRELKNVDTVPGS
jgi:hypothetical protein